MIGKFNSFECLEQGSGLTPNVEPDAFAVAPEFDCTEELRVEIDDTDETRPVRYTSDVRLILHTKDLASRAGLAVDSTWDTDQLLVNSYIGCYVARNLSHDGY